MGPVILWNIFALASAGSDGSPRNRTQQDVEKEEAAPTRQHAALTNQVAVATVCCSQGP